jgi:hypothetical protein
MAKTESLADTPKPKNRFESMAQEKEAPKKEKLVNFNTRMPPDLIHELKVYCVVNKITVQDFVTKAIRERLQASKIA